MFLHMGNAILCTSLIHPDSSSNGVIILPSYDKGYHQKVKIYHKIKCICHYFHLPANSHFFPVQLGLHKHFPLSLLQTLGLRVPSGLHKQAENEFKNLDLSTYNDILISWIEFALKAYFNVSKFRGMISSKSRE